MLVIARPVVAGAVAFVIAAGSTFGEAIREVTLPLRHEDIIRQQAERFDIDPALIAAVINAGVRTFATRRRPPVRAG